MSRYTIRFQNLLHAERYDRLNPGVISLDAAAHTAEGVEFHVNEEPTSWTHATITKDAD